MDEFSFDVDAPMRRVSDEEILRGIAELGKKLKRGFKMREWQAWRGRPCSATQVFLRFGGWAEGQRRAGLTPTVRWRYAPEELMEKLEGAWRKLGRRPGAATLRRLTGITITAYKRRWGTLRRACELLAAHKRGKISREEMLRPCANPAGRRAVTAGVRFKVMERDGRKCVICGCGAAEGAKLHVDHIVPVSKGGGNEMGNLRTLCAACNLGKGGREEVAARILERAEGEGRRAA